MSHLEYHHNEERHTVNDEHLADYYYNIHFSNLTGTLAALGPEMFTDASFCEDGYGQINRHERIFLYNFVKKIAPKRGVLEFSPDGGASTAAIGKALDAVGGTPFFETHEILDYAVLACRKHLQDAGVQQECVVKEGDVFETMDREHLKQADFLFVDSDHRIEFCQRYVDEFFPLLKDCWVGVHDMVVAGPFANKESLLIRDWVVNNNITDYFLVTDALKHYKIPNPFRPWPNNPSFYFKVP